MKKFNLETMKKKGSMTMMQVSFACGHGQKQLARRYECDLNSVELLRKDW